MGFICVAPYLIEMFVVVYSGSIYEVEAVNYRLTGPYWWAYWGGLLLPQLPWLGFLPSIWHKPILVSILAVLALIPATLSLIF